MFVTEAIRTIANEVAGRAKEELFATYPRDFELYICALELVTADGDTIDYFSFPIMPSSISKSESEATTIQHSLSGTTVFNKDGFTPNDLSIQGNFGRTFKVVFDDSSMIKGKAFNYSIHNHAYSAVDLHGIGTVEGRLLPFGVKTGFSCIKILQSIIDKAKGYDDTGRNFRLLFYNPALGESYLVVPTKTPLELSQNENQSNMLWNYTLNLSIICDLKDVTFGKSNEKSLEKVTSTNQLQKAATSLLNLTKKYTYSINTGISQVSTNIVGGYR